MPRPQSPPSYLKRVGSNGKVYARTVLFGEEVSLGIHGTPESIRKYEEACARWRERLESGNAAVPARGLTVAELVADFFARHAEQHYRHPDGTPTSELRSYDYSVLPLLRMFGTKPAAELSPLDLKAIQSATAKGTWLTEEEKAKRKKGAYETTWSRGVINQRVARIVRLWAWGVSEELVPVETHQALLTVQGLAKGRGKARETEDIPPVSDQDVHDTLPRLPEPFRTMALLQLAAGMRPGEVCSIRRDEIDRVGLVVDGVRVWVIRPAKHKTAWHGIKRSIVLGPAAQALLKPLLEAAGEWLFPAGRKSSGKGHVSTSGYEHAILKAARRAGVPDWSPNQLRKAAATEIEDHADLDTARATLGHASAATTKRHYAKGDVKKAAAAARRLG